MSSHPTKTFVAPALPLPPPEYDRRQIDELLRVLRLYFNQLDSYLNELTPQYALTAPVTGTYSQGAFVWNSAADELGAGGSKYVILGWVCIVGGTPGTWRESRVLTGN
jgi:hypothetical protein